jgi:hypothetical protein
MAPPQEQDNEFIDDIARYNHYDKIKKRMYIIYNEVDEYSNIVNELHAPNTFLISILMHSELDNLFNDWMPEWAYSPYVSKSLFSPTMEIIKVSQGDIGCVSANSLQDDSQNPTSIYASTINTNVNSYFYNPDSSLDDLIRWVIYDFPRTLRNTHRDPTVTSNPEIVSFYETHSKTLDDPYNPMNLDNIQKITKTSNSELINKSYFTYENDAHFMFMNDRHPHIVKSDIYDMRGIQMVNLNNGKIYNIGTVEGLRKLLNDHYINSERIIRNILSNNPETIPFELFSYYGEPKILKYNGLIHFFSKITMTNIMKILNVIGVEKAFIFDGSCSGLTDLKNVRTIKDRNALGRKKTNKNKNKNKKKYKRKTLKYKR